VFYGCVTASVRFRRNPSKNRAQAVHWQRERTPKPGSYYYVITVNANGELPQLTAPRNFSAGEIGNP